jgi:hypothetical protein
MSLSSRAGGRVGMRGTSETPLMSCFSADSPGRSASENRTIMRSLRGPSLARHRHFDERLAAMVALDPVCARGEISHGYAIYTFGATASHPFGPGDPASPRNHVALGDLSSLDHRPGPSPRSRARRDDAPDGVVSTPAAPRAGPSIGTTGRVRASSTSVTGRGATLSSREPRTDSSYCLPAEAGEPPRRRQGCRRSENREPEHLPLAGC